MKAIAIIGDIVESKRLGRKRDAFQKTLARALAKATAAAEGVASPYTITLGDEFQAVYRTADSIWADVWQILTAIHPVEARFAIGVGELATRLNPKQALGMDGPAFHRARAAMTTLKESGGRLRIGGEPAEDWALANRALALVSHHLGRWSGNRLRVLTGLLRGEAARDVERALGISRVAVYKNINAAALDEIAGICEEIARALNGALREK
ncbi:MAG TPA: SatD family protein [Opitutus sp.]|nr:SatD family protein [Opitutus sp.]